MIFSATNKTSKKFRFVLDNKWEDALKLCRSINDKILWACLGVFAIQSNNSDLLEIAEECFTTVGQYDKALYIQYLKVYDNSKYE